MNLLRDGFRARRSRRLWAASLMGALVLLLALASAGSAVPRVTVIGDSAQASFTFSPRAPALLGRGLDLRIEARPCRALSRPGCLGGTPESVLDLVGALGARLGDVVVVNVGYNDTRGVYDADATLQALRRGGVRAVVRMTLRESKAGYADTNATILDLGARAAQRGDQPIVLVADWNAYSATHPEWFLPDGVHLNSAGAMALAAFQREQVLAAFAQLGVSIDGRTTVTRMDFHRLPSPVRTMVAARGAMLVSGGTDVRARDERNGHARPGTLRLARAERLLGDGRAGWVAGAGGDLHQVRAEGRLRLGSRSEIGARRGTVRALARAGSHLWAHVRCGPIGPACPAGERLVSLAVDSLHGRSLPIRAGRVATLAGTARSLWVAVTGSAGRAHLERRDPRSGRVLWTLGVGRVPLALAAGRRHAWLLTRRGELLRLSEAGTVRRVAGGLAGLDARDDQLWVIRADHHTVMSLDPITGRARAQAISPVALSGRVLIGARHAWFLARSGRVLARVPHA